jgi:phosphate transport system substrate-binding protein
MNGMTTSLISKIIMIITVILLCSGVISTVTFAEDSIRVGGAGTGLGLMKILAAEFEKSNPGIKIHVVPSLGSSGGIKALNHGALDIAISGRTLTVEELITGVASAEFGRTPFVFIVNNKVNTSDVTSRELAMIYREELRTWPNGGRIRVVHRPLSDTDTLILASISSEMKQAIDHTKTIMEKLMAVTDQEAAEMVAKIPGAFCGSTLVQIMTEHQAVKVLSYNGVKPSVEALGKGSYPLAKPLYLVTAKNTSKPVQQFFRFLRSAKGLALAASMGIQPIPPIKGE